MFDPYHKWLGIPPKDQPPNHYRLLGIELFETDADVIDAAANKQMAYVQGCATGPHIALSQKLLNEIASARLCLLTPAKKADYDAKIKAACLPQTSIPLAMPVPAASAVGAITADSPAPASPKPLQEKRDSFDALESEPTALKRRKRPSRKWPVILGGAFLGVVGLVIVAVYSLGILNPSKTDKRKAELPEKKTPEHVKEKSQKQDGKNIGDKSDPVKKTQPPISEKEKRLTDNDIAVDLLQLVNPDKDALSGKWTVNDGTLVSPPADQVGWLQIPHAPSEQYTIRIVAEPKGPKGGINNFTVGLVGSGRQFGVNLNGWPEQGYRSGLQLVDGKYAADNATTYKGPVLNIGKVSEIVCSVRRTDVTVTVDGQTIISYKGDFNRLSPTNEMRKAVVNKQLLCICTWKSHVHITKMELTPIADSR